MTRMIVLKNEVEPDYNSAVLKARVCPGFKLDDEDEMAAEEERSCLNCRYRRWTAESFECINRLDYGFV